jgi:uncharacterized protein (DUF697 family)
MSQPSDPSDTREQALPPSRGEPPDAAESPGQTWLERWLRPRVDADRLEEALQQARQRQPAPVLWLLGKTQSGKTSLIRALTGRSDAEIGSGFRPCTRTSRLYDFPPLTPAVRFLDTRGLGERDYDPAEDLAVCEAQAHLVIAVMRVNDPDQGALIGALSAIRRRHPDWPLLMVQTCLHLTYMPGQDHPEPYPFDGPDWRTHVPPDTGRLIDLQRERYGSLPGKGAVEWVVVDLTPPDEGYTPPDYGLEALWAAIERVATAGLVQMLREDPSVRDAFGATAHPHIMGATLGAAALGAVPLVDIALVPALQWSLLNTLASIYGVRWSRQTLLEFGGLLGTGMVVQEGLRLVGRSMLKAVPAWGTLIGAVWGASSSAALTFALGKAATLFLQRKRDGLPIDATQLRRVYADAFARGRTLVSVASREQRGDS